MRLPAKVTPILSRLRQRFRSKRVQLFLNKMAPSPAWKILDLGGALETWQMPGMDAYSATLLNLEATDVPADMATRITIQVGDATRLDYPDASFDLVYSNSVIEHVGGYENQKAFAAEARRVAPRLWIQTPAHEFFFEPHYLTPFIHWVRPERRKRLIRWFTVWGWRARPSKELIEDAVETVRLINKSEMMELFPDCEIYEERFLGMTKSYVAIRS